MKIIGPLIDAIFIERPNRFITLVKIGDELHKSHLPDPGRLTELLIPGAQLLVKQEKGKNRKTQFSTQAIYAEDTLISLNTLVPNQFVYYLLQNHGLAFLAGWEVQKKEVNYDTSRFDFQLKKENSIMVLEVKSVTLVQKGISKFPDAVTKRGRRHVQHLEKLAAEGLDVMVLFVVQRPDAECFQPQWERDPKFSNALFEAYQKGLQIRVITMKMLLPTMNSMELYEVLGL